MPLDRNYFNSLELKPIKRKFYDIGAVDNILVDIRRQAELLNHRCESLQMELQSVNVSGENSRAKEEALRKEVLSLKDELTAALRKTEDAEARVRALELRLEQSEKEKKAAEERAASVQERKNFSGGTEQMEELYCAMKHIYLSGMEKLDRQWQSFLGNDPDETVPNDLCTKVGQIAETVQEINGTAEE